MIMKLPEGVEWALHCTWLLTFAREGEALPARRLAEFYDLPEAYLAKDFASLLETVALQAGLKLVSERKDLKTGLEVG